MEVTDRDLSQDYDESTFDRVGPPIKGPSPADTRGTLILPERTTKHSLTDLHKEYEFFTTGVIYTKTPFDRDIVVEAMKLYPPTTREEWPIIMDLKQGRFFAGLASGPGPAGKVDWNKRLYGILRDRWADVLRMITSVEIINRRTGISSSIGCHTTHLVDSFNNKIINPHSPPTVPITVFCVRQGKTVWHLAQTRHGLTLTHTKEPAEDEDKD